MLKHKLPNNYKILNNYYNKNNFIKSVEQTVFDLIEKIDSIPELLASHY